MKKIKKKFDCVDFKRKIQSKIFNKVKTFSAEDEILYFQKKALSGPLGNWWKEISKPGTSISKKKKKRIKSTGSKSISAY